MPCNLTNVLLQSVHFVPIIGSIRIKNDSLALVKLFTTVKLHSQPLLPCTGVTFLHNKTIASRDLYSKSPNDDTTVPPSHVQHHSSSNTNSSPPPSNDPYLPPRSALSHINISPNLPDIPAIPPCTQGHRA